MKPKPKPAPRTPAYARDLILSNPEMTYPDLNALCERLHGHPLKLWSYRTIRSNAGIKAKPTMNLTNNPMWGERDEKVRKDGYVAKRVVRDGRVVWLMKQRVLWEEAHGPIPPGMRLICMGDKTDFRLENWRLVAHSVVAAVIKRPGKLKDVPREVRTAIVSVEELKHAIRQREVRSDCRDA